MDKRTYLIKLAELQTAFENDEDKIERRERAGLYTVREVTEQIEYIKSLRDQMLDRLVRDFERGR